MNRKEERGLRDRGEFDLDDVPVPNRPRNVPAIQGKLAAPVVPVDLFVRNEVVNVIYRSEESWEASQNPG